MFPKSSSSFTSQLFIPMFSVVVYLKTVTQFFQIICAREIITANTVQKMKFCIKDFFNKCDQICSFLEIWSHSLKKVLLKSFIFCAVLSILNLFNPYQANCLVLHLLKTSEKVRSFMYLGFIERKQRHEMN